MDVDDRCVEKVRANGTVGFDDGRHPGRLAPDRGKVPHTIRRQVIMCQTPQSVRLLHDQAGCKVVTVLSDNRLDNIGEFFALLDIETNLGNVITVPSFGPVEGATSTT